jgi:hypothetical protein
MTDECVTFLIVSGQEIMRFCIRHAPLFALTAPYSYLSTDLRPFLAAITKMNASTRTETGMVCMDAFLPELSQGRVYWYEDRFD